MRQRIMFATTELALIRATPPGCLPPLNGCMAATSKVPVLAWQRCGESSTGMAARRGPKGLWIRAPHSISRWGVRRVSVAEPDAAPEPAVSSGGRHGVRQRRILVVEDADRDYALLNRELQKAGLEVVLHR